MTRKYDESRLTACEKCAFWTKTGCLKRMPYYPHGGEHCPHFVREPGVEG